jgi:hypothetical protein
VPYGNEHGSGDGEDRFLGAASCLDAAGIGRADRYFSRERQPMRQ